MEWKSKGNHLLKIAMPLLLGGTILYWMYRDFDFHTVGHFMLHEMDWTWMLLSFPFGILAQMMRGWRWKQTLEPIFSFEERGRRKEEQSSRCEVRGTRYENTSAAASSGEGNLVPRTSYLVPRKNVPRTSHLVPRKIIPRIKLPRIDYTVVKTAFKIGAPMGLQHLLMGGAQIVSTIIVAPLGTVAIAAHSLAITVESLCFMPGYGIAEAATTLVGQGIGAGQRLLTRSFANLSVALGIGVMTAMGVLMWIFAPELMALMSPVDDIIAQGTDALRIEAWAEPMFAASIVCNGIFIGAADTLRPAIMSLTSMWGVRLTLAAFLAPRYGLRGVWTAMAIELTFRGAIFLARLFRGRWLKDAK